MDINTLRTVITLVSLLAFVGIIGWTYSSKRKADFTDAANAPFEQD